MIPLALVAGFLGTGKTTFLKRMLERLKDDKKNVLFLINEFADADIDAALLVQAGGRARVVSGGSVFCVCKADEFKDRLLEAVDMPGLDGVIVEASGMAEPRALGKILSDPRLAGKYTAASLVALTDPITFPKLRHTLPAIIGQVKEADHIVINKCDLADPEATANVRAQLRECNPNATIHETVQAKADINPFAAPANANRALDREFTTCGDRNFVSLRLDFDTPLRLDDFAKALADIGSLSVRAKGWIDTPDRGRLFVDQTTAGGITSQPAGPGPGRMVVIVKLNALQAAQNRLGKLPGCRLLHS